jgi:phage terminase small subunit
MSRTPKSKDIHPIEALDPRERRFVDLYVETNKKGQSALVAGYGSNLRVASVQATALLKRPKIQAAIDRRNSEIMLQYDIGPERIIRRLAQIAMAPVEPKGGDAVRALEHLAKIAGLFPADRQFLAVEGKIDHQHKVDVEQLGDVDRDKLRDVLLALKAKQIDAKPEDK